MSAPRRRHAPALSLSPIAAFLLSVFGVGDASTHSARPTNLITVTSCADSGPGSLRASVASSGDGDTIDMTGLTCGGITLTSSRIDTAHNLLLRGPGSDLLTIASASQDRVFNQNGPGETLALYGMTLTGGYGSLLGGCVYSAGPVLLNDAVISGCKLFGVAGSSLYRGGGLYAKGTVVATNSRIVDNQVYSALGGAIGGGIALTGDLVLFNSTISGNRADSVATSGIAIAGGADVGGQLDMRYSTIADNRVSGLAAGSGFAGALRCIGPVTMQNSTVSGNRAGGIGGLLVYGHNTSNASLISNSTISGNVAGSSIGGAYIHGPIDIRNSTIAFNSEVNSLGAGLRQSYGIADIQSSIIAANSGSSQTVNIGLGIGGGVTGSHSLIAASASTALPPDTIQSDPRLTPLSNHGGATRTHELRSGSPAIDAGANPATLANDQRGPGYPRSAGAAPDIGAVEFDPEVIFGDGFD